MKDEKYGIETKHKTKEGYFVEIVDKIGWHKRRIRFENGYETIAKCSNIGTGNIKNPYHPYTYGVGYLGVGNYRAKINRKTTPEYNVWNHMIQRCYDKKYQERQPTYKGVTVCKEWLNFQVFADFYHKNNPKIKGIKFQLDKDLLQLEIENKIYSPDTCIFLPYNVNLFLANKFSNNTSGYVGVSWSKARKKWEVQVNLFGENKSKTLGRFATPEEASQSYQQARAEQSEKVKDYLRSLNYLPEETIQLVK